MADALADKSLSPGDVVAGAYRIEASLGAGGFGAVFRAVQLSMGRQVALKVLLPQLVRDPAGLSRFRREADLARQLEHPNTVKLFDFGVADDGMPFIAFELLRGRPLDAVIAEGPMAQIRVARIGAQVLKSLMEAHEKGVVHRDVKPANVFLCDFSGEPDFVKVLDFGIAKVIRGEGGRAAPQNLTRQGEAMGTPNYMAPEQVLGGTTSPATDVYALGLTMAEMLSGERLFDGPLPIEVAQAQASPDPVPLSPEVLQSPLGPVLVRATRKQPSERYPTAAEMLADLEVVCRRLEGLESIAEMPATVPAQQVAAQLDRLEKRLPRTEVAQPSPLALAELGPGFVPAPLGAPAPPRRRSRAPWIALAFTLVLGAGTAAFFLLGGVDLLRHSSGGPSHPSHPHTRLVIKTATLATLRDRVEDEGWDVVAENTSNAGEYHVFSVQMRRESKQGTVTITRYDKEKDAVTAEKARQRTGGYPVLREGNRLLEVVVNNDVPASKALLNELVK